MSGILGGLIGSFATASTSSYESIATFALSSNTATVTFSSIPSTYKHLQIRIFGKSNAGSGGPTEALVVSFNGTQVNNSNGYSHHLQGNGAAASAAADADATAAYFYNAIGRNGQFGASVIDVLDYADTNKNKTLRLLGGCDQNGSGIVSLSSLVWSSTSAINSIKFDPNGNSFVANSHLALYGIKGA
jgi:hypothetical protein